MIESIAEFVVTNSTLLPASSVRPFMPYQEIDGLFSWVKLQPTACWNHRAIQSVRESSLSFNWLLSHTVTTSNVIMQVIYHLFR